MPPQPMRRSAMPALYEFGRAPSLPQVTMTEIMDSDIGLEPDEIAQQRAEGFIRAALAFRMKAAQMREAQDRIDAVAEPNRVEIQVAADELSINVDLAEGIVAELARLAASSGEVSGFAIQ